jgi:hypothetical protein
MICTMQPSQIRGDDMGGTVTDRRLIIGSFLTPAGAHCDDWEIRQSRPCTQRRNPLTRFKPLGMRRKTSFDNALSRVRARVLSQFPVDL